MWFKRKIMNINITVKKKLSEEDIKKLSRSYDYINKLKSIVNNKFKIYSYGKETINNDYRYWEGERLEVNPELEVYIKEAINKYIKDLQDKIDEIS